jgi:hypothetical protein
VGIRPTPDSVDQERLYQSRGNQAAPAPAPQRKSNPQRKEGTRVVTVW